MESGKHDAARTIKGVALAATSNQKLRFAALAFVATLAVLMVEISAPRAAGVFAPTIQMETSTTRATAHPDARITIDNTASDENIKDLTLSLPDGFWGSLAAVANKCTAVEVGNKNCPEASRVGTVTATARIVDGDTEADGVLEGGVYLTDDLAGDDDPAGITIIVDAKVGAVDLGKVVVSGRAMVRHAAWPGPTPPTGAIGPIEGLDTVVTDIPQDVDDTVNNRQVSYKLNKMQIDLVSDLDGPNKPLLTNPSRCASYSVDAAAVPYGGGSAVQISDAYIVNGCDTVKFNPTADFSLSSNVVSTASGLTGTIELPENSGTFKTITTRLPSQLGAFSNSWGDGADRCPGIAGYGPGVAGYDPSQAPAFNPTSCPSQAKIGKVTVETPMIDQQLVGDVYYVAKTPLPWLGIDISPESDVNNPAGVRIRLVGITSTQVVDASCIPLTCQKQIVAEFRSMPDAPVTKVDLDLNLPDRTDPTPSPPSDTIIPGTPLEVQDPGENCQADTDFTLTAASNTAEAAEVARVDYQAISGCDPEPLKLVSGTSGLPTPTPNSGYTTDTTPSFDLTYSGADTLSCAIDNAATSSVPCTTPTFTYAGTPLALGAHRVFAREATALTPAFVDRAFVVNAAATTPDTTVPTTSLTAGPGAPGPGTGTTSDTTPTFTFNASETSEFQCSLDDGAFLPCGSATGTASDTYDIPAAETLIPSDDTHTFRVRAQDSAGNVDLSPATASFKVEVAFNPQVAINLTTTAARAHPEMEVTITSNSHEDLKDLTLNLPDGFFGGLTGVAGLCSIANADAGTCAAGSKVGTVDTEAVIDRSTARIKGEVFLTEPRVAGDPAALVIEVKPKLQDITFFPIRVTARLSVRGEAVGINTATVNIPRTATSTINEVSSFDLKKMVLKLGNNPAASQPLLTNPSSCKADAFVTAMTGYNATTTNVSIPFQTTGCEALSFGPQFSATVTDSTTGLAPGPSTSSKPVSANLVASVVADPNSAGIQNASLLMPKPLTMNVLLLPPVCEIAELAADACPQSTKVGSLSAVSPLLPEPLTGDVFLLRASAPGVVTPRLYMRLRGRINVNLFADNRFENQTQIRTTLTSLPDVPLSSFTINVDRVLSTRNEACDYTQDQWNITGGFGAQNGKSAGVDAPLVFDCSSSSGATFTTKFKNRGKKSTLKVSAKAAAGKKFKKLTLTVPKGITLTKKAIAKKVTVTAGGKKLKSKCFKAKSTRVFEVSFCKKSAARAVITFKSGSIKASKKVKKPKFKLTAVDSASNKRVAAKRIN